MRGRALVDHRGKVRTAPVPGDELGFTGRRLASDRTAGPAAWISHEHGRPPVDVPRVLSRRQYLDIIEGGD